MMIYMGCNGIPQLYNMKVYIVTIRRNAGMMVTLLG